MTPAEFEYRMKEIKEMKDSEERHMRADDLMARILNEQGYGAGVAVYETIERWYA